MLRRRCNAPLQIASCTQRLACSAVIALGALAACGGGGGDAFEPFSIATEVVAADIDGDGLADILTLERIHRGPTQGEGRLTVQRQTAPGVFEDATSYVAGCYPWSSRLADVDGDGLQDLVVADADDCTDSGAGRGVLLLLQDPAHRGRFLGPRQLIAGVTSYTVAVADLDADGKPDIAAGDGATGARRIVVLHQDPQRRGSFLAPQDFAMPGSVTHLEAGDIDGDGRADLLAYVHFEPTGYTPNSALGIVLQQPDGSLAPATTLAPQAGVNAQKLAIADVDGDGRRDLIVHLGSAAESYAPKLTVVLQASAQGWSAPLDSPLAGLRGVGSTAIADLNADGRPDVALAGTFPGEAAPLSPPEIGSRLNLLLRQGTASYAVTASPDLPIHAGAVAAGDVNGDGRNDLVLFGEGRVIVMLQSATRAGVFEAPQSVR